MLDRSFPKKFRFFISRNLMRLHFNSRKYWEMRYQSNWDSGVGSYGEKCKIKAQIMNHLIKELKIYEVLELGCGDGNQLQYYNIPQYLGLDVSKTTIRRCIEKFDNDPSKSFFYYDPTAFYNTGSIFHVQTAFSSEVLFHLVEEAVFVKYLQDLFSFAQKYVIIFSSNHDNNDGAAPHVYHRKFTNYVETMFPEWCLFHVMPCYLSSGEHFNDWFVFAKGDDACLEPSPRSQKTNSTQG